jgi:hypothetical protein
MPQTLTLNTKFCPLYTWYSYSIQVVWESVQGLGLISTGLDLGFHKGGVTYFTNTPIVLTRSTSLELVFLASHRQTDLEHKRARTSKTYSIANKVFD